MPKRIQLRRSKGWRKPAGAVVVSRPSRWGNPFSTAEYREMHDAQKLVDAYRALLMRDHKWFRQNVGFSWRAGFIMSQTLRSKADVEAFVAPLRGKDLCCWCKPGNPCHADVLLELANEPQEVKR